MRIMAIDPGPVQSAYVEIGESLLLRFGIVPNEQILDLIDSDIVIEKIASYGMAVGAEVFETVFWSGRFAERAETIGHDFFRLERLKVKLHLCHAPNAKDKNIRQALIDRHGGIQATKKGGALYGVSKDVWAALGVAVTFLETTTSNATNLV